MAGYMTCFGCLLCCFELRISRVEKVVRRLFGFMFSYVGRAGFLFFLAIFCLGIVSDQAALGWVVGVLTCLNALLNCFVIWRHPGFELQADPTQSYKHAADLSSAAASSYLASNPELAAQAAATAASTMKENPQLMSAGVGFALENPEAAKGLLSAV